MKGMVIKTEIISGFQMGFLRNLVLFPTYFFQKNSVSITAPAALIASVIAELCGSWLITIIARAVYRIPKPITTHFAFLSPMLVASSTAPKITVKKVEKPIWSLVSKTLVLLRRPPGFQPLPLCLQRLQLCFPVFGCRCFPASLSVGLVSLSRSPPRALSFYLFRTHSLFSGQA